MAQHHGFEAAFDDASYSAGLLNRDRGDWAVPELEWMHAIPNGGQRDKRTAAKLKSEGVKRGVLDVFLPVPVRHNEMVDFSFYPVRYCGLWIEMKRPETTKAGTRKASVIDRRAGSTSDEQEGFIGYARRVGYAVGVYWDWRTAANEIRQYIEFARSSY